MRSQSAPSRNCAGSVAIALGLSLAVLPGGARADDKQACIAAYDQAQELRLAGKLSAAREQALVCVRDACAEFIRTDCAKWLAEIESSQPTVVFDVRDSAGQETSAVRVSLDGKPWLDKLDGSAKAIDPGEHTLHLEIEGAPAIDQTVQIHEGQKNHELTATFSKTAPASVVSVAPTPSAAPVAPTPSAVAPIARVAPSTKPDTGAPAEQSAAPWIVGGVGVAGLVLGGVLTGVLVSEKATTDAQCGVPGCYPGPGQDAAHSGRALGPIATAAFIVGGLGVGVSAVLFLKRPPARSVAPLAMIGAGPVMTANGTGWRLQGSW